jgi:hypothetical protein
MNQRGAAGGASESGPGRLPLGASTALLVGAAMARVAREGQFGRFHADGRMFWLRLKKLVGSYVFLSATSRSYVWLPYASRIRSAPSLSR